MIGYHFLILLDGTIEVGRPIERVGAHCLGHNYNSIGICYVGGVDPETGECEDTRTYAQRIAMYNLVNRLLNEFPNVTVHGHNEFSPKNCPGFDVQDWIKRSGLV